MRLLAQRFLDRSPITQPRNSAKQEIDANQINRQADADGQLNPLIAPSSNVMMPSKISHPEPGSARRLK